MLDPRSTRRQLQPKTRPSGPSQSRSPRRPTPRHEPRAARVLLAVVVTLLGLLIGERLLEKGRHDTVEASGPANAVVSPESIPPPPAMRPRAKPVIVAQPRTPTPTLDLMVRLEAQRRITRAGRAVYFDSLLAEQDSLLRRWPDRPGMPVTVAIVRDSFFLAQRVDDRPIRDAFAAWQGLRTGVRFVFIEDTVAADVAIQWIDRFAEDEHRTGQTDVQLNSDGVIQHARVTLSLRDPKAGRLDRNALATAALHEVGHVIGLSHSDRIGDIMYPSPTVPRLSDRDRRTAELIYGLPPGTIKTQP